MITSYIAQSGSVAGTALPTALNFDVKDSGQVVDMKSNAELRDKNIGLINARETITITCKDPGVKPALGAVGALSLVGVRHNGGLNLSGSLSATATKVVVIDSTVALDENATPRLTIIGIVCSPDGIAPGIAWASA